MNDMSCTTKLLELNATGKHVCVGLDTVVSRLPGSVKGASPSERVVVFNRAIVQATADIACAFKPNIAFYEALGPDGFAVLAQTIEDVRRFAPLVPVIVDAKRADIGSSNDAYATAIFDELGADAITLHPYLGGEALAPFLNRADRMSFVLARTSNPGARELQDLKVDGRPLYEHVAEHVAQEWNARDNCGLVVGATYPRELASLRASVGSRMPFLIPGVGSQGGDVEAVVGAHRAAGSSAMVINVSRSVLYASSSDDFAEAARASAQQLHDQIAAVS